MPLFAFLESCVGIGLFVSGAFLLIISITLYESGAAIYEIASIAAIGAFLGDHAGFYLGRWLGHTFFFNLNSGRYENRIKKAINLAQKHGAWGIFIGRFVPAVRSLLPATLGISEFQRAKFTLCDFVACIVWAVALAAIVLTVNPLL